MKCIFHRYGNICEPDIIISLKKAGLTVIEDDIEIYEKIIDAERRVDILARLILKEKPIFVFSINFFPYISQICERLKVLYLCWSVDSPVLEIYSESIKNSVNRVFLFDYRQYMSVAEYNPNGIFYMPLATNVSRWDEMLSKYNSIDNCQYEVSFVGSLYNEYSYYPSLRLSSYNRGFFDASMAAQLEIDGLELLDKAIDDRKCGILYEALRQYNQSIAEKYSINDCLIDKIKYTEINYILGMEMSAIERINIINGLSQLFDVHLFTRSDASELKQTHIHGGVSTHKEMPVVFSKSKINLNITMRGIQTGIPQRVWDVLGCGGFLLTDYQQELEEYFVNGEDLVWFSSPEECGELAYYYLNHDNERRSIAQKGYEKVREHHTYDFRVAEMLKIALG